MSMTMAVVAPVRTAAGGWAAVDDAAGGLAHCAVVAADGTDVGSGGTLERPGGFA